MLNRSLVANDPQEYRLLPIFPQPPALSSHQAAWKGIYLESHRQPAYETPSYRYGWHIVGIHIGHSVAAEVRLKSRLQKILMLDSEICIFPANTCEWERCHQQTTFIDLHLEPTRLISAAHDLLNPDRIELEPRYAFRDPLIYQMILSLTTELELTSDRLYAESMATALSVHLLQRYTTQKSTLQESTGGLPRHKLSQAIEYIQDYLAEDLSVDAIAALVHMSPYHFSRLFKQSSGVSPYQYIIQCRIERAQQLLRENRVNLRNKNLTIADIAYRVGFSNQSHLNRHFKRLLGVTPKEFLQR
jgi:AraC family transcriptional regulator